MTLILSALYFFLPAYIGNSIPVVIRKINFLNYPIDFGKKFRGKRIFGNNKTIRGLLFGVLAGIAIFHLQKYLYINFESVRNISLFDYSNMHCVYGLFMALGALVGDMVESFFKRQKGIKSGETWWGFDQVDFVIGAFVFTSPFFVPNISVIIVLIVLSSVLSFVTHRLSYHLKMIDTRQ